MICTSRYQPASLTLKSTTQHRRMSTDVLASSRSSTIYLRIKAILVHRVPMLQSKISSFFKPMAATNSIPNSGINEDNKSGRTETDGYVSKKTGEMRKGNVMNKKRSYAQYHLELGQSDFLIHTCSVCGMMYSRGDESDEKVHKAYHMSYCHGISFKGWRNENVILTTICGDRIVLVEDWNISTHRSKVQQVARAMQNEMGFNEDQLLQKPCKVYFFVSSRKIVGCLVAEPIATARKVISSTCSSEINSAGCKVMRKASLPSDDERPTVTLQLGQVSFKREIIRHFVTSKTDSCDTGAILAEEQAVPALCGFRAIWVAPSRRRKGIASLLMDAARKSFYSGETVEVHKSAVSPPTSSGRALACSYFGTHSFLVYMDDDKPSSAT